MDKGERRQGSDPGTVRRPDDFDDLAERFVAEMLSMRRVMKAPGDACGHVPSLENVGRGSVGLLGALASHGDPVSPSLVARELDLTPARVSNILAALEREGLVERVPSQSDRRRVEVSLTDKGRGVERTMKGALKARVASLLRDLGDQDARELVRLMGRIVAVMETRTAKEAL